ncbi:flagellar hook-basal body complex protein FliE [Paracoccus jiaweipingae]|uniref:flagellar hook-basal body complex protein FliE n=1 Tax=unclassified Paracoccus (in: a-proteobacteria) TaxID=2688777 RepID=UPI0037A23F88
MITATNAANAFRAAQQHLGPRPGEATEKTSFEQVLQQADQAAIGAMTGKTDTPQLVQSIAEAELALETAVAIRDKVVEAYQELMRMPV